MRSRIKYWVLKLLGVDPRVADGKRLYAIVELEFPNNGRDTLMTVHSACKRYVVYSSVWYRDNEYIKPDNTTTHKLMMVVLAEDYSYIMRHLGENRDSIVKIEHKMEWSNEY